jgi:hypothetical protein
LQLHYPENVTVLAVDLCSLGLQTVSRPVLSTSALICLVVAWKLFIVDFWEGIGCVVGCAKNDEHLPWMKQRADVLTFFFEFIFFTCSECLKPNEGYLLAHFQVFVSPIASKSHIDLHYTFVCVVIV